MTFLRFNNPLKTIDVLKENYFYRKFLKDLLCGYIFETVYYHALMNLLLGSAVVTRIAQ